MPTVEEFLNVARAQIGIRESPPNSNCQKFSHELGRPCEQWCDDFVDWCAEKVNLAFPNYSASTRVSAQGFKDANQWGYNPTIGAIIYYDFPDNETGIQHTGIVESFTDTELVTIEGNTSADNNGSQSNGGGVFRRHRPRNSSVVGFGYPKYDVTVPVVPVESDEMAYIISDKTGADKDEVLDTGAILVNIPTAEDAQAFLDAGAKPVRVSAQLHATFKASAKG